jgi:site-specific DNA-adenine methylase
MGRRTPLSYYGGKQQLATRILEMIPEHQIYCEPFCGGAAWMLANGSYGNVLNSGFGYNLNGSISKKLANRRADFNADYAVRLQQVQIECCDALRIIRSRDTPERFFILTSLCWNRNGPLWRLYPNGL